MAYDMGEVTREDMLRLAKILRRCPESEYDFAIMEWLDAHTYPRLRDRSVSAMKRVLREDILGMITQLKGEQNDT